MGRNGLKQRKTNLFLHTLKTSENLWFSGLFRGYRKGLVAQNGLICVTCLYIYLLPDLHLYLICLNRIIYSFILAFLHSNSIKYLPIHYFFPSFRALVSPDISSILLQSTFQTRILNPGKHLIWSFLRKLLRKIFALTNFTESSILDVWQGSRYASSLKLPETTYISLDIWWRNLSYRK